MEPDGRAPEPPPVEPAERVRVAVRDELGHRIAAESASRYLTHVEWMRRKPVCRLLRRTRSRRSVRHGPGLPKVPPAAK